MTDPKPLHPLTYGNILIAGCKASNFNDEILNNPRVILWGSQNEHWLSKELPVNTRAVFLTKWIGHDAFTNIIKEARKKRITIFTPQGTGLIAKQVKELLNMNGTKDITTVKYTAPVVAKATELPVTNPMTDTYKKPGKLKPLHQFVNFATTTRRMVEFF